MAKKKITKEQLEAFIDKMIAYRDQITAYVENLQSTVTTFDGSNPPTPPPPPPILK